jgi:hypothetical protein
VTRGWVQGGEAGWFGKGKTVMNGGTSAIGGRIGVLAQFVVRQSNEEGAHRGKRVGELGHLMPSLSIVRRH